MVNEMSETGRMRQGRDIENLAVTESRPDFARRWVTVLYAMPLIVGVGMIVYAYSRPEVMLPDVRSSVPGPVAAPSIADQGSAVCDSFPEKVVGRWRRPDGGYVLEIRGIGADGEAQAGYFNPRPIHVAKAQVQNTGTAVALYVELQDTGYPGNHYKLTYDAVGDRLVGTYRQPQACQQFNIYFERLK